METFFTLLAICVGNSPVSGEFPAQRPVTLSFDVFFDLRLNKRLSKQPWGWWFETPSSPLWRHCNEHRHMQDAVPIWYNYFTISSKNESNSASLSEGRDTSMIPMLSNMKSNVFPLISSLIIVTLQWRYNSVSNHQPHDCFLNRLFWHRSKQTSKLRVTGLCAGNSPEAGEFPAQMGSNAEHFSIWWRHHETVTAPVCAT